MSTSQFFFLGAKLLCFVYINMIPFFSFFVFVFILDERPWHAIDVFVRLFECRFKNRRSYVVNSIMTKNVDKNRLIMISSCIYFIV